MSLKILFFSNCVWELILTLLKYYVTNTGLSDLLLPSNHVLNCTCFSDTDTFLNISHITLHMRKVCFAGTILLSHILSFLSFSSSVVHLQTVAVLYLGWILSSLKLTQKCYFLQLGSPTSKGTLQQHPP